MVGNKSVTIAYMPKNAILHTIPFYFNLNHNFIANKLSPPLLIRNCNSPDFLTWNTKTAWNSPLNSAIWRDDTNLRVPIRSTTSLPNHSRGPIYMRSVFDCLPPTPLTPREGTPKLVFLPKPPFKKPKFWPVNVVKFMQKIVQFWTNVHTCAKPTRYLVAIAFKGNSSTA